MWHKLLNNSLLWEQADEQEKAGERIITFYNQQNQPKDLSMREWDSSYSLTLTWPRGVVCGLSMQTSGTSIV